MKKILYFLPMLIIGCGDSSNVTSVKGMVLDYVDNSITLGNALDTRKICSSVKWDEYKDSRNREIVRYTCVFNEYKNYFSDYVNLSEIEVSNYSNKINSQAQETEKIEINLKNRIKEATNYYNAVMSIDDDVLDKYKGYFSFDRSKPIIDGKYDFLLSDEIATYREGTNKEEYDDLIKLQKIILSVFEKKGITKDKFNEYQQWPQNGGFPSGLVLFADNSKDNVRATYNSYMENINNTIEQNNKLITDANINIKKQQERISNSKDVIESLKIEQVIEFSINEGEPVIMGCDFEFYNGSKPIGKANNLNCLRMAYDDSYNDNYINLFKFAYENFIK